jgi:hypothetical protein
MQWHTVVHHHHSWIHHHHHCIHVISISIGRHAWIEFSCTWVESKSWLRALIFGLRHPGAVTISVSGQSFSDGLDQDENFTQHLLLKFFRCASANTIEKMLA